MVGPALRDEIVGRERELDGVRTFLSGDGSSSILVPAGTAVRAKAVRVGESTTFTGWVKIKRR